MSKPVPKGTFRRRCSCGWSGVYDTAGRADRARKRHSCDRWQAKTEAAQRGRDRMAGVDRTPKACLHKVADHQHGTRACYTLDGCRCEPCAAAVRDYETNRIRQHAYDRWDNMVDATPARVHVWLLIDTGMGRRRIAEVSGVSRSMIAGLLDGKTTTAGNKREPARRLRRETAEKLLAVTLDRAPSANVTEREMICLRLRLRALVALGWSQTQLAGRLGTTPSHFGDVLHGHRAVRVSREAAIRDLYDDLSMTLPPATTPTEQASVARSKAYAQRHGWLPPLALEDEWLDDPDYDPLIHHLDDTEPDDHDDAGLDDAGYDESAVLRRLAGDRAAPIKKVERDEIVRRARNMGWTYMDIERVAGVNKPDRYVDQDPAA